MAKKLLEGKVAVVTGSGRGIGRGIAILMASEGAKVVVNDIAREGGKSFADAVVKEIKDAKGTAVSNYDSVATMAGGEGIIKAAISNFGRIDILVNNAGNFWGKPTLELKEDEWDSIINVHLKGHFSCTKAALPYMVKQKGGRIINFSSRAGFFGVHNLAYAVVKSGVIGFTAMLAKEMKANGITVNAILPSATTQLFPTEKSQLGDYIPFYKKPDPDDVAPIVVYLATDKAENITGKYVYAGAGDICFYNDPFKLASAHTFVRKVGRWTLAELDETVPPLLGLG